MEDIIRLIKGTIDLVWFLIKVLVTMICVLPYFIVFILPVYIIERITMYNKGQ